MSESVGSNRHETARLAIVTGAASGIGRATTLALARSGCRVIATDITDVGLRALLDENDSSGDAIVTRMLDVTDWSAVMAFADETVRDFGTPTYLVANAGINPPSPSTADIDEAFWDQVMNVNLKGLFACNRAFLPSMVTAGRGAIVNLASVSGLIGWGGTSVYSASKGGVIALTRALAAEYADRGIRVNCVCPGSVRTPMVLNNLSRLPDPESRLRRTAELHPLKRVGEPVEIADAILYLLSDRASFVTGTALTVDGGLTAI